MSPKKKDEHSVDTGGVTAMLANRFNTKPTDQSTDAVTTAHRQDGMPSQTDGKANGAGKPTSTSMSKFTVLLDDHHALIFDELALAMRRRTGRRVDKAEIIRTLVKIAQERELVTNLLARVLDRRTAPPPESR
ncbi:hypothetical protein [Streptomyces sp. NPDC001205]